MPSTFNGRVLAAKYLSRNVDQLKGTRAALDDGRDCNVHKTVEEATRWSTV